MPDKRVIDSVFELVKERECITAEEATEIIGNSLMNVRSALNKLNYRNAIDKRVERKDGKKIVVFTKK